MAEKITKELLNRVIIEMKKEENQEKINTEIINPILIKFSNKIYPYLKIVFSFFILNFLLILIIFILIIYNSKKSIN